MAVSVAGKLLKIVFGLVMVGIVVAAGCAIFFFTELGARPSNNPDPVAFSITPGETFSQVSSELHTKNLIRNEFIFRLRAKMLGATIESGDFTLSRNLKVDEVLEKLSHGRLIARTVTIIEGWRAEEIAQLLAQNNIVKQDEFMQLVRNGDFSQKFSFLKDKPPNVSIEGFLFPDTYEVPPNYTTRDVIEMMLSNFSSKVGDKLLTQIQTQGGMWKVMTIASIVQREAKLATERPTIASVYYNRIKRNMLLQADPTVQYARDTNSYNQDVNFNTWWTPPTKDDLQQVNSPYNTYLTQAQTLPPGPICNPGLASIQGAAKPDQTEFLFFVADAQKSDGSHLFSKTYQEQLDNIRKNQTGS